MARSLRELTSMPKRILVVDDDPLFLACSVPQLAQQGYSIEAIEDPRHVEERVAVSHPHLLVIDEKMPWILGHELVERVRRNLPHIPCILITADARWVPNEFYNRFPIPTVVKDPVNTFTDRLLRCVRAEIGYAYEPTTRGRQHDGSGLARVSQVFGRAARGVAGFCR